MATLRSAVRHFVGAIRSWVLQQSASPLRWLFFVAFYALIANLPYWIASRQFGFFHLGVFCLEYALVGVLALFLPSALSALLLFLVMAADLLCGVCESYFLSIPESLGNIGQLHALPGARRDAAIVVLLLALLVSAVVFLLPAAALRRGQRRRALAALLAFCVLMFSVDVFTSVHATGHLPNPLRPRPPADGVDLWMSYVPQMSRNPLLRLRRIGKTGSWLRSGERASDGGEVKPAPSATAAAIQAAGLDGLRSQGQLPNLVLVLVESWGQAVDPALRGALVQPYSDPVLRARYEVVAGQVPFFGGTVAGESRELCGNTAAFHLLSASPDELRPCLPIRLAALGYRDIAVHGMNGNMFNRASWYRTIGFQEIWFNEQFQGQGLPDCAGAFLGTCDASIAQWIARRLEKPAAHPRFIHWVTLNSHLPVFVPADLRNGAPCPASLSLRPRTPLCSWYQLVANVHQSVVRMALGRQSRPTVFVVVGDHAPPFGDPRLRGRFSSTDVPYLLLLPRQP